MARLALNLTAGITEFSSRMSLKSMFSQFGEVTSCWVPPVEARRKETAWVKFSTGAQAEAALTAVQAGQIYLDGVKVSAEWRNAPAKTQDSRDFDAKGSNLFSSRDLMGDRMRKDRERDDRNRHGHGGRDQDRHRRGHRSRSRGKDRQDRNKKSSKRKSSSSSSSSSSKSKGKKDKDKDKDAEKAAPGVKVARLPATSQKGKGPIEIDSD
mmetsp:Transcript_59287/g.111089  ORF Transcript_59287/g.111089 Transcript_59287/m.111089 type:complete len:210 (-) Transcript_59287:63-692(-)